MRDRPLIYLATPYSHDDWIVKAGRVSESSVVQLWLQHRGLVVYNPLTAWEGLPGGVLDEARVRSHGITVLQHCDLLVVLKMEGWEKSIGVQMEIDEAKRLGMGIVMITSVELHQPDSELVAEMLHKAGGYKNRDLLRTLAMRPLRLDRQISPEVASELGSAMLAAFTSMMETLIGEYKENADA